MDFSAFFRGFWQGTVAAVKPVYVKAKAWAKANRTGLVVGAIVGFLLG